MQKLLSPILIMMLILGGGSLNSGQARAGNENQGTKINEAFENFRYRLSVMPTVTATDRAEAAEAFKQDLEKLTAEGIPAWTILEHLKQEMLDRETRDDFGFWLGSIDPDSITPEQAAEMAS